METLKKYIEEGLLRGQQSTIDSGEEAVYVLIEEFLKENYLGKWIISEKPNKDGLYEVTSNGRIPIRVKNKQITSLTNNLFIWTGVKGDFYCDNCNELKSLEGAPKIVEGSFCCAVCNKLKSLEGAPKEVEGVFYCNDCEKLESLEGAPKEVEGVFYCRNCSGLKSLKGAPKKVGEGFNCSGCNSLKSLEGAPKEVGTYFDCHNCGKSFIKDDIRRISKVFGNIYC